jgi:hypothetical protein
MFRALLPASLLAVLAGGLLLVPTTRAAEVGYVEDFALAKDRAGALKQLIPGTEDYYYFNALHALNTGQYAAADAQLKPWIERFGHTPRVHEILLRKALLTYETDPKASLGHLIGHLGLHFNHQREVPGAAPNLPTALDPKRISRDTLRRDSVARWSNLDNFEDSALDWLAADSLTWGQRRHLLQRLQRPDVPNLPKLLVDDLGSPNPPGLWAYPVHSMLTLPQLEELRKLRPDLINHGEFVRVWVTKLQPGADTDWRRDKAAARAFLDRLWAFAADLPPVHNSLKAHVQFHRLALDRSEGKYDKSRFVEYLKLPRHQPYMSPQWNSRDDAQRFPAHLNVDYSPHTLLPTVNHDQELVAHYLKHFLVDAPNAKEFESFIEGTWLDHVFAETKVVNGIGDPEAWASKLPPALFAALRDRVDLDFADTNKTDFAPDEPVKLGLHVKNVPTLLVKVFEVNTANYYRTVQREIDTDINLDGLVANAEQTHPSADPPLRRTARTFEFPQLTKPGVYVIDFIGNGKSSRALVRKGRLRPLVETGTAGQTITVVDEQNRPVPGAGVWLANQEYRCNKDGRAVVPFTAQPGRRAVVLSRGEFCCLDTIEHQPEGYRLDAGIHADRESLLTSKVSSVVVRPALYLNERPVSVKLLEDVKLRITSRDHNGIATSTEVPEFKLFEDRESVHEFRVPGRLAQLDVVLTAKVKSLSLGTPIDLAASQSFPLNQIDRTDKIEDLHLAKFGQDYAVELLGRTGEARPDRQVNFALKHRDFKEPVHVSLKTDPRGRVVLGPLADIVSVQATGPEGTNHTWALPLDRHTYRQVLHATAAEPVTVPYLGTAAKPLREELALFEVRGGVIAADRFDSLAVRDGLVEATGLEPGDYDLFLKREGERVRIRVTTGPVTAGYLCGPSRSLQVPGLKPVQIKSVGVEGDAVAIRLTDNNRFARVHVFATRYVPTFSAFDDLGKVRDAGLRGVIPTKPESVYLTGRNIGDEMRYVLDRRGMKKFPGNMLERPQLLLNPWAIRSTEAGEQHAQGGDMFRPKGEPKASESMPAATPPATPGWAAGGAGFPNLDFLADPSTVLLNLEPDQNGVIRIDRAKLGPHGFVRIAAVDPLGVTVRSVALAEPPARFVDLRFREPLDPAAHFTQQKQVSVLGADKRFVLADAVGSRFEAYDSLPKVYALFATLSKDPRLTEFAFLTTWPKLKDAEKREQYSKFACHELHYFLAQKDPAFFAAVVKPYLANKKDKTFMDHYLLGADLGGYLDPWRYGRLNAVERVLLARRLPGEAAKTARHLDDLVRLLPPNAALELMLFDTAVQAGDLGRGDDATRLALDRLKDDKKLVEFAAPARMMAVPTNGSVVSGAPGGAMTGRPLLATPVAADPQAAAKPSGDADHPELQKQMDAEKESGAAGRRLAARDGRSEDKAKADPRGTTYEYRARLGDEFHENERVAGLVRQLYRKLDPTLEWAENNYYKRRITEQTAALVTVNPFWVDYARHAGNGPFLSRHLAEASRNFTEMMFALSVLDLPFDAGKHRVKFDGGRMELEPASPVIAFHEEVRRTDGPDGKVPVLIGQHFYRHGDRFREENGEKVDKYVTGEFLTNAVYGCQVVVTNPTSTRQRLSVLVQVPAGAIPVAGGQYTRTVQVDLEAYRTHTVDALFYFPLPGTFDHYPAQVAKAEKVVAAAKPNKLEVLAKPSRPDDGSWDYVSQFGTDDEVLAALGRENVHALNLDRIAFRMKDLAFFERVIAMLKERHAYNPTLWSYALLHNVAPVAKEFLTPHDQLAAQVGGPIDTPLLTIDPVARHTYEHLEYKPLVNARAHSLGNRRQIVNGPLNEQYHRLLKQLSYKTALGDDELLAVTYYLLLQDRIEEALGAFARVKPEKVATRLQYDYCAAYLALFTDEPERARAIAARYAGHPVDRWKNAFAAVINHLDEASGKGLRVADPKDPAQAQGNLASTEPAFEAAVSGRGIALTWQNLDAVSVSYIPMDVEVLFSRTPFAQQGGGQPAFAKPHTTQVLKLPAGKDKVVVPVPDELEKRNLLVEVTAAGKTRVVRYFAADLDVKLVEGYGQLKATDAAGGKPLAKVYVKVYAKLADGSVKFHKDGYTDVRGRFDYASVNTPERRAIEKFSVLVLSDDRGAVIREVAPPQQ